MQINLKIEKSRADEVGQLIEELLASEKVVQKSIISARRKAAKWVRTQLVRALSKATGAPSSILRRRVLISRIAIDGTVFVGVRPVAVSSLAPKQTKTGVKAKGGVQIKGAFISLEREGTPVFKRVTDKAYPLAFMRVDIAKAADRIIEGEILPLLSDKLYDFLEHELKWRILYKQKS